MKPLPSHMEAMRKLLAERDKAVHELTCVRLQLRAEQLLWRRHLKCDGKPKCPCDEVEIFNECETLRRIRRAFDGVVEE